MKNQTVELLAPAGDYACFMAAINAGADAVYLGGTKFGARAYANNFSQDEIAEALRVAHLFHKKIYLTVNTLVKESEMPELVPYIAPLYEAGLDGVIVQDIGVLKVLREHFPALALHASTQMTVTGVYGAQFVKSLGVCRVVPARELSLDEIRDIKEQTGLEVECFIHGAMCYAYSGQCLFSSILGGRSGNRGRCAGPCRLPYTDENKKQLYPLSLKDMYTLPMIPKLIEAGIDSFKIEGRMKKPEYVAGVTAVYRKYIDQYLSAPDRKFQIAKDDELLLRGLYIRSDLCHGYYETHNGKNMITIKEPGYGGLQPEILEQVQKKYLDKKPAILVKGKALIYSGKPAVLTLYTDTLSVTVEGDTAGEAINRPLTKNEISDRLSKLGDTFFVMDALKVDTDNCSFMTVKALNMLRRNACLALEHAILGEKPKSHVLAQTMKKSKQPDYPKNNLLAVSVSSREQLAEVLLFDSVSIVYLDSDLFLREKSATQALMQKYKKQYFLALPHILRKRSYAYLEQYQILLKSGLFTGVLVRNFETFQWLKSIDYDGQVVSDYTIYAWNNVSLELCAEWFDRVTLPLELNRKEMLTISDNAWSELLIYGRVPLMFSANCLQKTLKTCMNKTDRQTVYHLTDRYQNTFPVVSNCLHCYNILYNTVPLSLHGQLENIQKTGFGVLRLAFTLEDGRQTKEVLTFYDKKLQGTAVDFNWKDFTNGHYKRGVE